jgi:hypothetical protein
VKSKKFKNTGVLTDRDFKAYDRAYDRICAAVAKAPGFLCDLSSTVAWSLPGQYTLPQRWEMEYQVEAILADMFRLKHCSIGKALWRRALRAEKKAEEIQH